jgi:hypothetical protein
MRNYVTPNPANGNENPTDDLLREQFLEEIKDVPTEDFHDYYNQRILRLHDGLERLRTGWLCDERTRRQQEERKAAKLKREAAKAALLIPGAIRNRTLAEQIFYASGKPALKIPAVLPLREGIDRIKPFGSAFVRQLHPEGMLSPREGLWLTPCHPFFRKISLDPEKGGAFWLQWEDKADELLDRDPIKGSNYLVAWILRFYGDDVLSIGEDAVIRCRDRQLLANALRDTGLWCAAMENGYTETAAEMETERCNRYAEIVIQLFDNSIRNNAKQLREYFVQAILARECSEEDIREAFPELLSPTHWRVLLRFWKDYGNPCFNVRECRRQGMQQFMLRKLA